MLQCLIFINQVIPSASLLIGQLTAKYVHKFRHYHTVPRTLYVRIPLDNPSFSQIFRDSGREVFMPGKIRLRCRPRVNILLRGPADRATGCRRVVLQKKHQSVIGALDPTEREQGSRCSCSNTMPIRVVFRIG